MNKIRFTVLLLVIVALAFGLVGPAHAATPTVDYPSSVFGPINLTVEVGQEVSFCVTNPEVNTSYMWDWGNGTPSSTGKCAKNAWNGVGLVKMFLLATNPNGFSRSSAWVTVVAASITPTVASPMPAITATPEPVTTATPAPSTATPEIVSTYREPFLIEGQGSTADGGRIKGDYNVAPVFNGNDNNVTVKIFPVPTTDSFAGGPVIQITVIVPTAQPTPAPMPTPLPTLTSWQKFLQSLAGLLGGY